MAEEEIREENVADIDFSQIRTSIQLGGRMIEQILNSVHYGSPEVRCLLLDECDIILECRVCRGLFRALPNFVAHKRIYCRQAYIMTKEKIVDILPDEEIVVVEPAAPEDILTDNNSLVSDKTLDKSAADRVRDTICQINDGTLGKSEMYKLYSKAAEKTERQKKSKRTLDIVLSKIASNPNAVRVSYQEHKKVQDTRSDNCSTNTEQSTLQPHQSSFADSSDVNQEQSLCESSHNTFTHTAESTSKDDEFVDKSSVSDMKKMPSVTDHVESNTQYANTVDSDLTVKSSGVNESHALPLQKNPTHPNKKKLREEIAAENILDISSLKCLQCNTKYSSRKTLVYHVQMHHSGLRTFFPCPYCSNVFFYFWGLTRHLRINHKKSPNQINKMRKILREAAFTKSVTKPCIQAKDQLEFSTEIKCVAEEKPSDTHVGPLNAEREHETLELKTKLGNINIGDMKKVSKATVKHTSRRIKHTFAQRFVPQTEEVSAVSTEDGQHSLTEDKLRNANKYNHQLSCDVCKKFFWKKNRLTNHRKFCCSSRNVASSFKVPSKKFACPLCGKMFMRKYHLERHSDSCSEKNQVLVANGKGLDEYKKTKFRNSNIFNCQNCERNFEKRISLENHKRSCHKTADSKVVISGQNDSLVDTGKQSSENKSLFSPSETQLRRGRHKISGRKEKGKSPDEKTCVSGKIRGKITEVDELRVVEEIWIHKQPGRPSEKVKSNHIFVMEADSAGSLHCQDSKKLSAIVDETEMKCTKCGQDFTSVSNLRRHAIRHLGWKRYKCKLCRFSSYNKSECNTHIIRTHSEKYRFASSESLIVDLNKESSRIRNEKKLQTLTAKKTAEKMMVNESSASNPQTKRNRHKKKTETEIDTLVNEKMRVDPSRKFNISTRNSPRKFDTRPYQKLDSMSTLFTRKGYYPKPCQQSGGSVIDISNMDSNDQSQKNQTVVHLSESSGWSVKDHKPASRGVLLTHEESIEEPRNKSTSSESRVAAASEFSPSSSVLFHEKKTADGSACPNLKQGEEDRVREAIKGKKRQKCDDSGAQFKYLRADKMDDDTAILQAKKQSVGVDTKSTDFLAPWPRASEPMSVKEMFALIRRSPRAGCGGAGRRKSLGDAPIQHLAETISETDPKPDGRRSAGTSVRLPSKHTEGKAKLGATLARRNSPAGNTLSLSLRTSRPGVDWSRNTEKKPSYGVSFEKTTLSPKTTTE